VLICCLALDIDGVRCGRRGLQVSAVAFDPYWEVPTPDTGAGDVTTYRFGSVGQVSRLSLLCLPK